jgi:hypothetical protein
MSDTPRRPGQGRRPQGIRYPLRITVPIDERQRDWLDAKSIRRQITVAELIRTLIEEAREIAPELPDQTP